MDALKLKDSFEEKNRKETAVVFIKFLQGHIGNSAFAMLFNDCKLKRQCFLPKHRGGKAKKRREEEDSKCNSSFFL